MYPRMTAAINKTKPGYPKNESLSRELRPGGMMGPNKTAAISMKPSVGMNPPMKKLTPNFPRISFIDFIYDHETH